MSTPSTAVLTELAKQAMKEKNLLPEFSVEALKEVEQISTNLPYFESSIKDMRELLWFSIDNEDSKDLDQLSFAETLNRDHFRIYIAIADVAIFVKKDSAIDQHAQHNTTSIYTPTRVFSMLPEELSNNLSSLNEEQDRYALIIEIDVNLKGKIEHYAIYRALVRNKAKLNYHAIGNWLEGHAPFPEHFLSIKGLQEQIQLQNKIALGLRQNRHEQGALTLDTIEVHPLIEQDQVREIKSIPANKARQLIEDFMIAANTAVARYLKEHQLPSLKRIVRIPKRWDRIVDIAYSYGDQLPQIPDAKALDLFLIKRRLIEPHSFPDLSLTIIKLLGSGEYIVEYPGEESLGHFSLAIRDYTHSTAPNRRYPDLITQRIIKASLSNQSMPYTGQELENLAQHCTLKEDDASKVERQIKKSATILFLYPLLYHSFDAIVTGKGNKGTWVRVFHPAVEGKLVEGFEGVDVGDRVHVKLVKLDIDRGFIDFAKYIENN